MELVSAGKTGAVLQCYAYASVRALSIVFVHVWAMNRGPRHKTR